MFDRKKSMFIVITLSLVIALTGFFQLQPIQVKAEMANPQIQPGRSSSTRIHPARSAELASTGLITGKLSFPSERIPPLTVFAFRIDNGKFTYYSIQTEGDQFSYSIRVDPGVYQLVAYNADLAGGYTRYAQCELGAYCSDHTLLPVVVQAGDIISDVDLVDWYAPSGTFPARPGQSPQSPTRVICSANHTILPGENLFRIGLQYNMTWKPIAIANKISNPNLIFAGQVLCIPKVPYTSTWDNKTSLIPTFEISSVVKNKRVTIQASNFPAHTTFVVTMGKYGTKGIGGLEVARTETGSGSSFTGTYSIPQSLRGLDQIAIRLQSSSGYYSYNWFYNNSTN